MKSTLIFLQFRKVFVGGLPGDVTAAELQEYFEAFGKVCYYLRISMF